MEFQLYNSLSRTKEVFKPQQPPQVKIYLCGPTVYDFLHIGNFRGPIFFNFLRRYLQSQNYQVKLVVNITDIDDKIIDRAKKDNKTSQEISENFIQEFKKDYLAFGLPWPDETPKVSEYLGPIIQMIEQLIKNGHAYTAPGETAGSFEVFYSIDSFKEYGKLSHRNPQELLSAVRIEKDFKKKNVLDFSLWKPAKAGEPSWPSPWGPGRPGWHIECSAMATALLGTTIDIHGGGLDLLFPHHENEIAQSEGCTHQPFARFWVHNNMIEFGGAKMSKSLGNVRTARNFLEEYPAEILKYLYHSVHYRSLCDFSDKSISQVIKSLSKFYQALEKAYSIAGISFEEFNQQKDINSVFRFQLTDQEIKAASDFSTKAKTHFDNSQEALKDDLNTPEVFAEIFMITKEFMVQLSSPQLKADQKKQIAMIYLKLISAFSDLFFIFKENPSEFLKKLDQKLLADLGITEKEIQDLINQRAEAKKQKNFPLSDQIRDQLLNKGISVKDTPQGTMWEVTK